MRIVIMTDLEGVSGVVDFDSQTTADSELYHESCKLLTGEVNAAIEGFFSAGVDDIMVIDGHGPGGIDSDSLHKSAKLLNDRPLGLTERVDTLKRYDVTVMIGQHSMAGTEKGNLSHTQNHHVVEYYQLNGRRIGEIAQWALFCGTFGLPLIFLSGDDATCSEAEDFIPGISTCSVKQGLSQLSAVSMDPSDACDKIREYAEKAIYKYQNNKIPPCVWHGPYELIIRYNDREVAGTRCQLLSTIRKDCCLIDDLTIRIKSKNIAEIIHS